MAATARNHSDSQYENSFEKFVQEYGPHISEVERTENTDRILIDLTENQYKTLCSAGQQVEEYEVGTLEYLDTPIRQRENKSITARAIKGENTQTLHITHFKERTADGQETLQTLAQILD